MGFDPFRKSRKSVLDLIVVAVAIVAAVAVVVWALLPS